MDYGNLLSRAWQITWKHKLLWIFGILAGLAGGGNRFNFGYTGPNVGGRGSSGSPLPPDLQSQLSRPETVSIIVAAACVLVVIILVLFVVGTIARGGLIGGIRLAADGSSLTFGEVWSIGTRFFPRLLGISLLIAVPVILIVVVFGGIAILTAGIGLICLIPLLCLIVPAFIVAEIVAYFARFAVVLEDLGVMDSFRRGWAVLKSNLGPIIVTGIIMLIIEAVVGFVLAIPIFVILVPTMFATFLGGGQPNFAALAAGGVAFLCSLPVLIVLAGILNTWSTAVWTLLYRHVTGSTPSAPGSTFPAAGSTPPATGSMPPSLP